MSDPMGTTGPGWPEANSVHGRHLSDDAVAKAQNIPDGAITLAMMGSNSVDSSKIVDASIALGDLAAAVTAKLITQQAAQPNSVAADVATLVTDFNSLLAKLRSAGVIAT